MELIFWVDETVVVPFQNYVYSAASVFQRKNNGKYRQNLSVDVRLGTTLDEDPDTKNPDPEVFYLHLKNIE